MEDALLILPGGDTIRGRNSIALYLAQLAPEAISADFHFGRDGELEICGESARERLAYTAYLLSAGGAPDTVSGKVAVFWTRDRSGELKVAWAALGAREVRRHLTKSECPSPEDSVWRSWRVALSLFPAYVAASNGVPTSIEGTLRSRGWVAVACGCNSPLSPNTPISAWTTRPGLIGMQYRLRRRVVAEIVGGRLPKGSTMGAKFFSNGDFAQTRLLYSGTFAGTLVSYERWGFQLGIGPAIQSARWVLRDSFRPYNSPNLPVDTDVTWSKSSIGFVVDAKFQRVIYSRLFVAVRLQARQFREAETPASARFAPARVNQNSEFLGVGFGVVF